MAQQMAAKDAKHARQMAKLSTELLEQKSNVAGADERKRSFVISCSFTHTNTQPQRRRKTLVLRRGPRIPHLT